MELAILTVLYYPKKKSSVFSFLIVVNILNLKQFVRRIVLRDDARL